VALDLSALCVGSPSEQEVGYHCHLQRSYRVSDALGSPLTRPAIADGQYAECRRHDDWDKLVHMNLAMDPVQRTTLPSLIDDVGLCASN
jgi:hypothetical protein